MIRNVAAARCRGFALATTLTLGACVAQANLVNNPDFANAGPAGSPTTHAGSGPVGDSSADRWPVFHNNGGASETELLPTSRPGGTGGMLRVSTDATNNGVFQAFSAPGTGPANAWVTAWILNENGRTVIGAGDGGSTGPDVTTSLVDVWEQIGAVAGNTPVNEVIVYSDTPGGNTFFVDEVTVEPIQAPDSQILLEYSNLLDEEAVPGGDRHGTTNPGVVLYTEPSDALGNGLPFDIADVFPGGSGSQEPDQQVDALANGLDAYFEALIANAATLLISTEADGFVELAALAEDPAGTPYEVWRHEDLDANDVGLPLVDDLDAMELHGPVKASDADYFSLEGDGVTGVSVWTRMSGSNLPYVPQSEIIAALYGLGWDGQEVLVDVDALMVRDADRDGEWGGVDAILFSIRPNGNFDGGEIILLEFGIGAKFLEHGGHRWDTAFSVAATFNQELENVDALEAALLEQLFPTPPTVRRLPTTGLAGLLAMVAGVLLVVRSVRRRMS